VCVCAPGQGSAVASASEYRGIPWGLTVKDTIPSSPSSRALAEQPQACELTDPEDDGSAIKARGYCWSARNCVHPPLRNAATSYNASQPSALQARSRFGTVKVAVQPSSQVKPRGWSRHPHLTSTVPSQWALHGSSRTEDGEVGRSRVVGTVRSPRSGTAISARRSVRRLRKICVAQLKSLVRLAVTTDEPSVSRLRRGTRASDHPLGLSKHQWSSGTTPAFIRPLLGSPQSGRRAFDSRLAHMENSVLCLRESPPRKIFKEMAGQNNHFLITLLVGLEAVKDGTAQVPLEMRTAWAPHDRTNSVHRSREYAIKSLLVWLISAVDSYIRNLQGAAALAPESVRRGIDEANREQQSLLGRIRVVAAETRQEPSAEVALLEIAVVWRNRLIHNHVDGRVSNATIGKARSHEQLFLTSYQGLIIDDLLERARRSPVHAPRLKEVTAIVRCAQKFVERADAALLHDLDLEPHLREIIRLYLMRDTGARSGILMHRANNVWGKSPHRRRSTIHNIALNGGFSVRNNESINCLDRALLTESRI
jgi:hypothetical protein